MLYALPLETLTPVAAVPATQIHLESPKPVRLCALPRGGFSRRIDAELPAALDPAYDLHAEAHTGIELSKPAAPSWN